MNWTADPKRREAVSDSGYKITWAKNDHGKYFNAWAPMSANNKRRHLEASYDKRKVVAACEAHLAAETVAA